MKVEYRLSQLAILLITILLIAVSISQSSYNGAMNNSKGTIYGIEKYTGKPVLGRNSLAIDPMALYSKEPAPMGITDFGIGGNNRPYEYTTRSFMGSAYVYNISTYNKSINGSQAWLSFQLNVNLVFKNANSEYVYWIQDVAELNSSNYYIGFVDNIWNFSSTNSRMNNSSISGSGTVAAFKNLSFYYSFANQSLPGNNVALRVPFNLEMRVISGNNSNGVPNVAFQYNDGYGWVTYDNTSFIFAKHLNSKPLFMVDGYSYEPTGYTFYDAEMIMGGPGNGSSTTDIKSNVHMSLFFWNGHNYQAVSNAYNFGSNTAETLSNAVSSLSYSVHDGQIYSELRNGTGTLGILYQEDQMSVVNISTSVPSGTLFVNKSQYNFQKNGINLTLYPSSNNIQKGYYHFVLENADGKVIWERNISLTAGEHLSLDVNLYKVQFIENGIPNGTLWSVQISNGGNYSSINNSITVNLSNGTYDYHVYVENGNKPVIQGSFVVLGNNVTLFLNITAQNYPVYFKGSGLPAGIIWYININGQIYNSRNTSFHIFLPNGTYNYSIAPVQGFRIEPSSGIFVVNNSSLTINVNWSLIKYMITIKINDLPNGSIWSISLNGSNFFGMSVKDSLNSTSSIILIYEPNGSYGFSISVPSAYYLNQSLGIIHVNGSNIFLTFTAHRDEFTYKYALQSLSSVDLVIIGIIILAGGSFVAFLSRKK